MDMRGKTNSLALGIEILTPVQCGSGQDLIRDMDYVAKDKQVFVVDQVRSFNEIANAVNLDEDKWEEIKKSEKLQVLVDLAGYYGYTLKPFNRIGGVRDERVPDKIRAHLKDAYLQPYIAGSSIKGAIRTALIAEHLRALPDDASIWNVLPTSRQKPKEKFADDKLLEALLGKDPKQDIFRALHSKDAIFSQDRLCLVDIRWLNLVRSGAQDRAQWRSMAQKKSYPEWQKADGIHAEMLRPKSTAEFHLQWDEFLLSDVTQWHTATQFTLPANFNDLKTTLNQHARYRLNQEIAFYHHYGVLKPAQECQKLLQQLAANPNSIYLQLSWGSGWRGMTGDWLDEETSLTMRHLYNLGKETMPFPKTRRLAVVGEPKLPLGWVRLYTHDATDQPTAATSSNQAVANIPLSVLEQELQALKGKPERDWDGPLLQKLEQARSWDSTDKKQVAEKIQQLMTTAGKWCPEYVGTDKDKLKYKTRSLKVLAFITQ